MVRLSVGNNSETIFFTQNLLQEIFCWTANRNHPFSGNQPMINAGDNARVASQISYFFLETCMNYFLQIFEKLAIVKRNFKTICSSSIKNITCTENNNNNKKE